MAPKLKPSPKDSVYCRCKLCKSPGKNCVSCDVCSSRYHPACLIQIKGLIIDQKGNVVCCDPSRTAKSCDCNKKDVEIQRLKRRLSIVNMQILEKTFSERDQLELSHVSQQDASIIFNSGDHTDTDVLQSIVELKQQLTIRMDEIMTLLNSVETMNRLRLVQEESIKTILDKLWELQNGCHMGDVNKSVCSPVLPIEIQVDKNSDEMLQESSLGGLLSVGTPVPPSSGGARCRMRQVSASVDVIKPRALVIGDNQCRNASFILKQKLRDMYQVETVFKPNATFEQSVENLVNLCSSFGSDDVVIIMAGINNVRRGVHLNKQTVGCIFKNLSHTRCIVISVPYFTGGPRLDNDIYRFNVEMYSLIATEEILPHVNYISVDSFLTKHDVSRSGFNLTDSGKHKLFRLLSTVIFEFVFPTDRNSYVNKDNLRYVTLDDINNTDVDAIEQCS